MAKKLMNVQRKNRKNGNDQNNQTKEEIANEIAELMAEFELKPKPKPENGNNKITLRQILEQDGDRFNRMMKLMDLFEKA